MKKSIKLFFTIVFLLSLNCNLSYSENIKGNGKIIKTKRDLNNFSKINIAGAVDVELNQADQFKVVVKTDQNIQDYIITEVKNGEIFIYKDESIKKINPTQLKVFIFMPALEKLKISGASDIEMINQFKLKDFEAEFSGASSGKLKFTANNFTLNAQGASDLHLQIEASEMKCNLKGASDLYLKGNCNKLIGIISGSSDINGYMFKCKEIAINASGASNAKLHATEKIFANISGASDVLVKGKPKSKKVSQSGSSTFELL